MIKKKVSFPKKKNKYDLLADETEKDLLAGRGTILKTKEDVDRYFKSV